MGRHSPKFFSRADLPTEIGASTAVDYGASQASPSHHGATPARSGLGRRGPSRFRQSDVARAIRAAKKEQLDIAAIKIEPDGTILIVPGTPQYVADSEERNEWDE